MLYKGHLDQVLFAKAIVEGPTELNKVSEIQCKDKGNATLPANYKEMDFIAILDSGASISIATKTIWEEWENQLSNERTSICN